MCEFPSLPLAKCHVNELTPYYKKPIHIHAPNNINAPTAFKNHKCIKTTQSEQQAISGEGLKGF